MAFVSRSKRNTSSFSKNTPSGVGPGSYELSARSNGRVNYAPFSTSAERASDANFGYTPGPGEYTITPSANVLTRTAPASGSAFVSGTIRFNNSASQNPGPGTYTQDPRTKWGKQMANKRTQRKGKVKWVRVTAAPSIPSSTQSYGYEENKQGDLVLQSAPQKGYAGIGSDSVGAGSYDPYHPFGVKARGTDWSTTRSHRPMNKTISKKYMTPGPGDYRPEDTKLGREQPNRLTAAYKSGTKRAQKVPEPTPGPGYYEAKPSLKVVERGSEAFQFFGSKQLRNTNLTDPATVSNPGPGEYNIKSTLKVKDEMYVDPIGQSTAVPFTTSGARFKSSKSDVPGPGEYNAQNNLAYDLSKKVFGRNTSFNVTQQRFHKPQISVLHTPGPGAYVEKKLVVPVRSHGVFASETKRFNNAVLNDKPGPASYEIDTGINHRLEGEYTNKSGSSFKSGSERKDLKTESKYNLKVPGVGSYHVDDAYKNLVDKKPQHGSNAIFKSEETRFKSTIEDGPGPGAYTQDKSNTTMNKKSFNITIASGA